MFNTTIDRLTERYDTKRMTRSLGLSLYPQHPSSAHAAGTLPVPVPVYCALMAPLLFGDNLYGVLRSTIRDSATTTNS